MTQTTVPNEPQPTHENDAGPGAGANVDAHMPAQPGEADSEQNPIYANPQWNPDTNEWAPSNEQHSTFGVAEPSHGDDPSAEPMSESYGRYDQTQGSVPDARKNLLDAVREPQHPLPAPTVTHHHIVETQELASARVRARLVVVVGNATPSVLLEENQNRDKAFISVFTAGSTILLAPVRQGGVPQLVAAPTTGGAFFPLATADGRFEVKSQGGVECYGISAAGVVLVAVWEEMTDKLPGLGV